MYPGDDAEECTRKLEINANLSNSLLNASGGGDNFLKSFWYLVEQVPEDGAWRTLSMEENPDRIIQVEDHDNGGVLRILERKEVTQVHRTLGYNLNLVESNADAVNMLVTSPKPSNSTPPPYDPTLSPTRSG